MKKSAYLLGFLAIIAMLAIGVPALTMAKSNSMGNMMGKIFNKHMMNPVVSGTVASISGSTITLNGANSTTYTVNATGAQIFKVVNNAKTTIQVSGIQNGDTLTVSGTISGTNVTATKILDGTFTLPIKKGLAVTGTITAISGNTITVNATNGTTYAVDASKAQLVTFKPSGTAVANSGIQTNDSIAVFGTITGTNISATRIVDGQKTAMGMGMMGSLREFND